MEEHSRFGGSAAGRIFGCPGSVGLTERAIAAGHIPAEGFTSEYAEEGTRAHTLLETALKAGADAYDFPALADDLDMTLHVQKVLDDLRSFPPGEWWSEVRVYPFPDRGDVFGTMDFAHLADRVLSIVDLKYGAGIRVNPRGNDQLRFYALGLLNTISAPVDKVRTYIHQPRMAPGGLQLGDEMTPAELREWGEDFAGAIALAETPDAPLSPGSHCRWCPAKAMCPAQSALLLDSFQSSAPPALLSDQELGDRLAQAGVMRIYLRELETIIINRITRGIPVPGWKMVRRKANRVWSDEAEKVLVDKFGSAAYKTTLVSPAVVEKLPGGKDLAAALAYAPDAGLTLAPEDDPRRPVILDPASLFTAHITKGD